MQKNRLLLLVFLILLVAVYLFLRARRPEEKQRPIYDLDSLSIARIEVFDKSNTLKLEKQKGIWMLTQPVQWEADTLRIQSLFKDIFTAKYPRTPMGEGTEAVKRFRLQDSEAFHLVVSDAKGNKRIHTMFSNLGNPYDYFRYAGSNQIFQIKKKVVNQYSTELPMWRSPHVVNHQEADLEKIEVRHAKNSYTLTRKQYDWYYQDGRDDFQVPRSNLGMAKVVNILANLNTYVFVDGGDKTYLALFDNPECVVTLHLSRGRKQELSFVKYDNSQYLLMVDKDPSVLFVVAFDTVFRFMRHAEIFQRDAF